MTNVISKIDVHRLKVGDLLINILVQCALLLGICSSVGRYQRPSNPAIASS